MSKFSDQYYDPNHPGYLPKRQDMSAHCHNCGAVASYGYEIAHKSDCPALHQKPPRKRTPEEEAAFRRVLTMPVDEDPVEGAEKALESRGIPA